MISKKKKFSLMEIIALFLLIATTLFLVTPLLFTVVGSFSKYWGKSLFGSGATVEWYKYVYDYYGHTIGLALARSYSVMRQSGLLILIGHVIFTFPLMFRSVSAAIRSQNLKSIDEAARSLGAGFIHHSR